MLGRRSIGTIERNGPTANAKFHFANAPMLLGQKLAAFSSRPRDRICFSEHHHGAARYDSHCVAGWMEGQYLGAQVPAAGRVCGTANPRFVVSISDNAVWLVSVQILDGVAAGTLDALIRLVLADNARNRSL